MKRFTSFAADNAILNASHCTTTGTPVTAQRLAVDLTSFLIDHKRFVWQLQIAEFTLLSLWTNKIVRGDRRKSVVEGELHSISCGLAFTITWQGYKTSVLASTLSANILIHVTVAYLHFVRQTCFNNPCQMVACAWNNAQRQADW